MKKSTFLNEFIVHFSLRMRQKIRINLCGGCQVPPRPCPNLDRRKIPRLTFSTWASPARLSFYLRKIKIDDVSFGKARPRKKVNNVIKTAIPPDAGNINNARDNHYILYLHTLSFRGNARIYNGIISGRNVSTAALFSGIKLRLMRELGDRTHRKNPPPAGVDIIAIISGAGSIGISMFSGFRSVLLMQDCRTETTKSGHLIRP